MKWSWKIAQVAGIGIYVHATFLILLVWVGVSHFQVRGSWNDVATGLLFIAALFAIVVLHELGHALTAKKFGIRTRDITLLPIGGVARLERIPDDPKQELLVALAGPAVNVILAIILLAVLAASAQLPALQQVSLVGGQLFPKLLWINISLAVFNLLPAFPMDGGRILRALLAIRMNYARATQIAARIGQAMAVAFGFIGLFANPFLIIIALFVWMGAAQEAGIVQMRSALAGIPVSQIMMTDFHSLLPNEPLSKAVEYTLSGWQRDFPVLEEGRVAGVLTQPDLVAGLTRCGPTADVKEAMQKTFQTAEPTEAAEQALTRLQSSNGRFLAVVRNGRLLGIVTVENLGEFLMFQAASQGERRAQSVARPIPRKEVA